MHIPPLHSFPALQAALFPQRHSPVVPLQLSPRLSQSTHTDPLLPQVAFDGARHVVAVLQHPAHVVALQGVTHAPPTHTAAPVHAAPPPHWQLPDAPHASDVSGAQATQAEPLAPQVAAARGLHTPAAQQPPGQFTAVQPIAAHAP